MITLFSLLLTNNLLSVNYFNNSFTRRNIPIVIVTSHAQNNNDISPKRGDGRREN
jgi:hypothetical protein